MEATTYTIEEVIDFLSLASEELGERYTVDEQQQLLVTDLAIIKIKQLQEEIESLQIDLADTHQGG